MKNLLKWIFVLFIVQNSYSQTAIKGNVSDKTTNQPIPNVFVYVSELNKAVTTDESGNYEIKLTVKGTIQLQFSHIGYESSVKKITMSSQSNEIQLDILLEHEIFEINKIVISNSFVNEQKKNTFKVDVVNQNDIQKFGGFTIMDALNKIPGIEATTTGTLISRPVIRGLSSNRVLTVIDGVRFETQQWDDEHGIGVNENGVDRIEVIKGPESLLFGPEAMGGVINFVKAKPAAVGTTKGSYFTSMSSNNLGWRALANVDGAKEEYNWGVSGLGKLYSDYFVNNQSFRTPNTRLLEYGFKSYIGTDRKWGSTNLSYNFNQAFFGILDGKDISFGPNGELINSDLNEKEKYPFEIEAPFHAVVDHRITSTSTFLTGKSKFDVVVGYQNNHRTENEERIYVKKGYKYVDMTLQTLTYNAKWYVPKWNNFSTIVGSQGMFQNNTNNSGAATVLIPNANVKDLGFFAVSKFDYKNFNFTVGTRYDSRKIDTDDTSSANYNISAISKSYDNVSSSLGLAYTLANCLTLRTSFAKGYRSPNLNELTTNGYKLESRRFEVGNPNFQKEYNNQFDFNATYVTSSVTLEGSYFFNAISNYIYIAPTGNTVPNNTNPSQLVSEYKYYQADAELTGGEARLDIHPKTVKWVRFETKYAILEGKRTDNDSFLPMMSPTKLTNTIYFNFNDFRKFSKTSFNISVPTTFDQNKIEANELRTKGYSLLNFGFFTTYKKTEITLTANNVLDKQYVNHMSRFRQFGISEPGLNVAISVRIPIDIK